MAPFSHDQAPERTFAAMLGFEAVHVSLMSFEPAEVINLVSQALALLEMTGRVLVPLGAVPLQGEVNQGSAQNGRGQRMLGFQCSRGRREDLVEVTIEFVCAGEHQVCGLVQGRPGHQKA